MRWAASSTWRRSLRSKPTPALKGSYGNENSPFGSGWGAVRMGQWSLSGSGEGFRTDGYIDVPQRRARHRRHTGQRAVWQRKRETGAALRRSRPRLPGTAICTAKTGRTARRCRSTTPRSANWPLARTTTAQRRFVHAAPLRRHAELSADVLVDRCQPRQRVADRPAARAGAADGADRAVVEAARQPLHHAGGTRRNLRSRRQPGDNVLRRQSHGASFEWRHAGGAGRFPGRHCADHAALVADAGRPRRPVEQLRRQLHPHSGARHADRHQLSRPRPERLQSARIGFLSR